MQRLYSMFPAGVPGIGLLLLRISVALGPLIDAFCHRQGFSDVTLGVAILLSIALFAGYLTPVLAAIALLLHGTIWVELGGGGAALNILICLDMIALVLVGPGGYSVDAFRFGRRVVVLPPD